MRPPYTPVWLPPPGYRNKSGLGHLTPVAARGTSRPQVHWKIECKLECQVLIELLDAHPLRGRKRREYEIWREATILWASRRQGLDPAVRSRLATLAEYIRAERIYRQPPPDVALPDMTDQYAANYFAGFFSGEGCFLLARRNARFVTKLRRDDRPLLDAFCRDFAIGCSEHPDWPKRETIAEAFGSWYGALRSAGLAARAARPRPTRPSRVRLDKLHGHESADYRAAVVRRLRGLLQTV